MKESKIVRSLIATASIITLTAPVFASGIQEASLEERSVKVSYADLNLTKEAGVKALYRRLQNASEEACGVESFKNSGSVRTVVENKRCYREALASVVRRIDNDRLTKIHEG